MKAWFLDFVMLFSIGAILGIVGGWIFDASQARVNQYLLGNLLGCLILATGDRWDTQEEEGDAET